jgi:K+-sensing histidine kinase KdpD
MPTQPCVEDYDAVSLDLESTRLDQSNLRYLAHDLRNPLQALLGFVWILQNNLRVGRTSTEATRQSISRTSDKIERITEYLDRVLSNSLEYDEARDPGQIASCDLTRCVADALEYSSHVDTSRLALRVPETELLVRADPTLTTELIISLISGTLAQTPPEFSVACNLHVQDQDVQFSLVHDLIETSSDRSSTTSSFHFAKLAEFAALHGTDFSVTHAAGGKAVAIEVSFRRASV